VECLLDELVGHVGAVHVAGVDVGDAQLDRLAQDADGLVVVRRRPHDVGASQLHRAVAKTGHDKVVREVECSAREWCVSHAFKVRLHAPLSQCPALPGTRGDSQGGVSGYPGSVSTSSQLGEYLRARSELVRPEDVSLPVLGQRRVAGLRREEVAMLAGISSDYYLRLEQGRDHNPSVQVLESLARVLRLDETATAYLIGLAAPQARRRARRHRRETVPASIRQLVASIGLPAFVESRYSDVLAANDLAYAVSPNLRIGENRMRTMFLDRPSKRSARILSRRWPTWWLAYVHQSGLTPTTRGSYRSSASCRCQASDSGNYGRVTTSTPVRVPQTAMYHPQVGELTLHKEGLVIIGGDGLVLVIYHPTPGTGSAEKLSLLAAPAPSTQPPIAIEATDS